LVIIKKIFKKQKFLKIFKNFANPCWIMTALD